MPINVQSFRILGLFWYVQYVGQYIPGRTNLPMNRKKFQSFFFVCFQDPNSHVMKKETLFSSTHHELYIWKLIFDEWYMFEELFFPWKRMFPKRNQTLEYLCWNLVHFEFFIWNYWKLTYNLGYSICSQKKKVSIFLHSPNLNNLSFLSKVPFWWNLRV